MPNRNPDVPEISDIDEYRKSLDTIGPRDKMKRIVALTLSLLLVGFIIYVTGNILGTRPSTPVVAE